jgi:hypothetical protein
VRINLGGKENKSVLCHGACEKTNISDGVRSSRLRCVSACKIFAWNRTISIQYQKGHTVVGADSHTSVIQRIVAYCRVYLRLDLTSSLAITSRKARNGRKVHDSLEIREVPSNVLICYCLLHSSFFCSVKHNPMAKRVLERDVVPCARARHAEGSASIQWWISLPKPDNSHWRISTALTPAFSPE